MNRRVNYKGEWFDVGISDEEVDAARQQSMEENHHVAARILALTDGWAPEVQAVLVQQATQHFIFKLDDVAIATIRAKRKAEKEARR